MKKIKLKVRCSLNNVREIDAEMVTPEFAVHKSVTNTGFGDTYSVTYIPYGLRVWERRKKKDVLALLNDEEHMKAFHEALERNKRNKTPIINEIVRQR